MLVKPKICRWLSGISFLCLVSLLFLPLKSYSAGSAREMLIPAGAPTPTATPAPSPTAGRIPINGNIYTYVSVIDPKIVEDVFGKRISDRFVAIQVTITNKNSQFQFLIHDVSLDLKNVFGKRVSYNLALDALDRSRCVTNCMKKDMPRTAESADAQQTRVVACRAECGNTTELPELRFELSSLELSLIRGVAEKGQAQDKRNKILRYLEGVGTVAASLVGIAGFGPSYAGAIAVYNGDLLAAYRHIYPDFTINQMNRLSDSAYKSNTLIPKDQAKVLVAFIPQAIFLTPDQRQNFRKDPTSLYPDYYKDNSDTANTVDFRRAIALVDGNFIVELKNLPVTLTGVQIDPDQALEFLKPHPVVKGYILGQFPEDANISLVSPPAGTGMTIAIDSAATPEEGKIAFVITASAPVPDGSPINFRVFNKQNSQTFAQTVSYTTPVPGLEEKAVDAVVGTDKSIELLGTNLIDGVTTLGVFNSGGVASGVKIDNKGVGKNANGDVVLKADLKMSAATAGSFTLKAKNGNLESNPIKFEIKPKPTPNATPKPTPTP